MDEEMEKYGKKKGNLADKHGNHTNFQRLPMFKIVRFPKNLESFFHTLDPFPLW